MAQPPFVPQRSSSPSYVSPPRRAGSWTADRPGEIEEEPTEGEAGFGNQGPDQGYLLKLAGVLDDDICLAHDEDRADVVVGCAGVGMKRASLFGRGPVLDDMRAALTVWGYLGDDPPAELLAARRAMFAEVAHAHHYVERRAIADAVDAGVLRRPYDAIEKAAAADWRAMIDLPDAG